MEEFINKQILSFNKKKYNLLQEHEEILKKYPLLLFIIIKDNKIYEKKHRDTKILYLNARLKYIDIIFTFFLQKYKIKDTYLFINLSDGFFWRENIPVFNWALPDGFSGLIFPNFDILNAKIGDKEYDFDEVINKCLNYEPAKIDNEIFFIGKPTAYFRKNLSKISESPLKVIVSKNTDD